MHLVSTMPETSVEHRNIYKLIFFPTQKV